MASLLGNDIVMYTFSAVMSENLVLVEGTCGVGTHVDFLVGFCKIIVMMF